jgi:non-homologous end joining protein Ku
MGNGIRGITLRYSHEVRDEASYFAEIPKLKLPKEMLGVAEHIVETKMSDFDPAFLEDRYRTVLISKLKEKRAEVPKKALPAVLSAQNVISLMDVLKRSLAAAQPVPRTSLQRRRVAWRHRDVLQNDQAGALKKPADVRNSCADSARSPFSTEPSL